MVWFDLTAPTGHQIGNEGQRSGLKLNRHKVGHLKLNQNPPNPSSNYSVVGVGTDAEDCE